MGKIKVMGDTLINKIAAGEVVEKIANVVKELVENSIDAESKNIKVELVESGTKLIRIVDDGIGMSHDDAILCFSRHATSKIKNENDLYFINTLGFRGEALAAISAVSNTTLDTYDGKESTLVNIKAGKIISEKVGSKRIGTVIEVRELFYNTPARLKFLIADKVKVSPSNVHGYVIGEHGDSEFIPWSNVNIALQPITDFITQKDMDKIAEEVKTAAYKIINAKGATYYGIGMCLVRITNAILGDENTVMVISTYDETNDVYIGLPSVINKNGAERKIHFNLNTEEAAKLNNSINILKSAIKELEGK